MNATLNRHHVVVVGAGFGGLETVRALAGAPVRITIHLVPRRRGDVENPLGGVRGVIPDKMRY